MKTTAITAVLIACALTAACRDEPSKNIAGLTEATYKSSQANTLPMSFPGREVTLYKEFGKFKDKEFPKPYSQPHTWVVYMAAPGWTNGGKKIVDRLATDAVAIERVKQFVYTNHLHDQVRVAWLQYDSNPNPLYVEGLDRVPDNFIPLFLKPHGPQVDLYIHSPAVRYGQNSTSMRYDEWLKPYLPFAKKIGQKYVAANDFQHVQGFDDPDGKYWDSWARHWFIVNPEGKVVDAYFSNLGNYHIQGADKPINSLIHHLKLDPDNLDIPKIVSANYESFYTAPYWDKLDSEVRETLGVGEK
jgi:hypothetical protein